MFEFLKSLWNWLFPCREKEEPFFLFESDKDFDQDAHIIADYW